jgi:hypothetical protein
LARKVDCGKFGSWQPSHLTRCASPTSLKRPVLAAEQVEAVVRVIVETQDELVTRHDLDTALSPLRTDLAVIKAEMTQIKWLQGLVMGGIVAILVKVLGH